MVNVCINFSRLFQSNLYMWNHYKRSYEKNLSTVIYVDRTGHYKVRAGISRFLFPSGTYCFRRDQRQPGYLPPKGTSGWRSPSVRILERRLPLYPVHVKWYIGRLVRYRSAAGSRNLHLQIHSGRCNHERSFQRADAAWRNVLVEYVADRRRHFRIL